MAEPNTSPLFTKYPKIGIVELDTGMEILSVITGGTNGTRITRITIMSEDEYTDGAIILYIDDGVTVAFWKEVVIDADVWAGTTIELLGERALVLPATYELQAMTINSETFVVIAEAGDY